MARERVASMRSPTSACFPNRGAVAVIGFWPLAVFPAFGAYKQREVIDHTWQFIAP
ncbi:MAG: hypothetical protein H5T68_02665 [Chloroflexi bacterium]|nr:hypothetical protein [Chloroflexota bacterium]